MQKTPWISEPLIRKPHPLARKERPRRPELLPTAYRGGVWITVATVGQCFGSVGTAHRGFETIETAVVGFQSSAAWDGAFQLAVDAGWITELGMLETTDARARSLVPKVACPWPVAGIFLLGRRVVARGRLRPFAVESAQRALEAVLEAYAPKDGWWRPAR